MEGTGQEVWQLADPVAPHLLIDRPGVTVGERSRPRNPGLQRRGNKASNLCLKTPVGVEVAAGETPSLTEEVIGETHRGLEHAQAHPLGKQQQRGPI